LEVFSLIIPYIIILIVSIILSFLYRGLVNKFIKEEEMYEEYEIQHEDKLTKKLSKEEKQIVKNEIKSLKAPFKPSFDIGFTIFNTILISILYYIKGLNEYFFIYSLLVFILEVSFYTDIKAYIIPDETNYFGLFVGVIFTIYKLITYTNEGIDLLVGGIAAFLIFFMIGGITYLIIKKEGMGGGDIKLVAVIGLFLGLKNFIQVFVIAFLVAAIVSIFLLIFKKKTRTDYVPFGPFLCIGTYITMLIPAMTTATFLFKLSLGVL